MRKNPAIAEFRILETYTSSDYWSPLTVPGSHKYKILLLPAEFKHFPNFLTDEACVVYYLEGTMKSEFCRM